MKILNFGSLNYDYVYSVNHIVEPGETIFSTGLDVFCGGKGLNQSVALARAGSNVYHAGMVGSDGEMLCNTCKENNINSDYIKFVTERTGNAIIQVSENGQNSIVLFGGANRKNTEEYINNVLSNFQAGDMLLMQNEINLVDYLIEKAFEKQMIIALNPSPFDEKMLKCNFNKVSYFLMNEVEGKQITGKTKPEEILEVMRRKYPSSKVVLTLGKAGVIYSDNEKFCSHGIYKINVLDTTAAGDTFTGFFLSSVLQNKTIEEALRIASVASSIAVSKKGATSSIPFLSDVLSANLEIK